MSKEGDGSAPTALDERCCFRSCTVRGAEKHRCAASDCGKECHVMCYQGFVLNKYNLPPLVQFNVACTKSGYSKAQKELAGSDDLEGPRRGNWDGDGKAGVENVHTSMKILLDWWMKQGNYSKFCGKHNGGVRKKDVCQALAAKMTEYFWRNSTSFSQGCLGRRSTE
jgi:hypothetical protein